MLEETHKRECNRRLKIIVHIVLIVFMAIVINVFILDTLNEKSSTKTASVLLTQIVNVLEKNKEAENALTESLKDEYKARAKALSYIVDSNPEIETDILGLFNLASLISVDEIHFFDESGLLYAGTVPKYYGLTLDSGEQISFFRPMLTNKNLSMCQDVTPNTAEFKNMMYAITWNSDGTKMIQIGIEPHRLIEELQKHEIPYVLSNIPSYEGSYIYVADINSGIIIGSTDRNAEGKALQELEIVDENADLRQLEKDERTIHGYKHYCVYSQTDNLLIAVLSSTKANVNSFLVYVLIEFIYLAGAGIVIYIMLNRVIKADKEKNDQLAILTSMSDIYYSMHLIDLNNNTVREYSSSGKVKEVVNREFGADVMMKQIMTMTTLENYLEEVLEFTDLSTLSERMRGRKIISLEFEGNQFGWCLASFITIEKDSVNRPTKVIYVTQDIDNNKRKEQKLIQSSNTDELTGLFNRRAYEDDIGEYNHTAITDNFVYVSLDINALKIVNDTLGHAAGDELILGAVSCMKQCLSSYGRIYRTGGDEFAAMIFASEPELAKIKAELEESTAGWSGELVNNLSISCGFVTKTEVDTDSVYEMSLVADKRMYEAKSAFYRKKGVDRRGQKEAHVVLCELYSKILKINISNDSCQIINMDADEQTPEMGFSTKISSWLKNFGSMGLVHPDDLEEYLMKTDLNYMRSYFESNKTSLDIFYRRKIKNEYKQVMMEIIPASDYSETDQNLFLYVKNIDKNK